MQGKWAQIDCTPHRKYFEVYDEEFLPCLAHVGWSRFLRTEDPITVHTHGNVVEFCYILRGNVTLTMGDEEFALGPNHLFVTPPNVLHGTGEHPTDRMDLYWIGIRVFEDRSRFLGMDHFEEIGLMQQKLLSLDKNVYQGSKILGEYITNLINLFMTNDPLLRPMATSIVMLFLREVFRLSRAKSNPNISSLMRECLDYVEHHVFENLCIADLAETCDLTESHFKHRFRNEVGIPPGDYILRAKIRCATEYLQNTDSTITDIAHSLGFSSSQYFATVFKRFSGCTPSDVRRECMRLCGRTNSNAHLSDTDNLKTNEMHTESLK